MFWETSRFPAEREVLIDHLDAEITALMRAPEVHRLPVDENIARVALIGAGQDFHQCRLACRIVADEPEDLARHQIEVDVDQRPDRPEALVDRAHLNDRTRHVSAFLAGSASAEARSLPRAQPNHSARMLC